MTGYDGQQVYVGGSQQSSAGASSQDVSLKEENRRLKEAIKFVMGRVASEDEIPEAFKDLTKEDPREVLKQKQRALNEERKALNRLEKVREQIASKESRFTEWKHSVQEGVLQEEKRHVSHVAELQEKLKSIEKGEEANPIMIDSEEELEPQKNGRSKQLEQELNVMRDQMQQVVSYTAHMEAKNNSMLEQLQWQMNTLIGTMTGASLVEGMKVNSPEQSVHPRKVKNEIDTTRRDAAGLRSRSPAKRHKIEDKEKMNLAKKRDYSPTRLKEALKSLPEKVQAKTLSIINTEPEKYVKFEAIEALIHDLTEVWNRKVLTEEELKEAKRKSAIEMADPVPHPEGPFQALPVTEGVGEETHAKRDALRPFGRIKPPKEGSVGPYTPPMRGRRLQLEGMDT